MAGVLRLRFGDPQGPLGKSSEEKLCKINNNINNLICINTSYSTKTKSLNKFME